MNKFFGMKITTARAAIAAICLIVGCAVSLQIKSVLYNSKVSPTSAQRAEALADELIREKDKSQGLFAQAQQYKEELEKYQEKAAQQSDASQLLADELRKAEISAGLADVEGPGVIFTMSDAPQRPDGTNAGAYLIHDSDLLSVINELANAGAEAISLNGERILSTSSVRCAGSVVTVNGQLYGPPFVVRAIGDPTQLKYALEMPGGVMEKLGFYQIQMDLKKSDKLQIPRYARPLEFKYASPVSAADVVATER